MKAQRMATCHPDRRHLARGLCRACYQKAKRTRAKCHPDLPEAARGMCQACYARYWRAANPARAKENSDRAYAKDGKERAIRAYHKNPASSKARGRKWVAANRDKVREYNMVMMRSRRSEMSEAERERERLATYDYHLRRHYGITLAQFEALAREQRGLCAICKQPRKLCVDHCHATGRVRALLCNNCNMIMGQVETHPGFLERLTFYADEARALLRREEEKDNA